LHVRTQRERKKERRRRKMSKLERTGKKKP
jgi:hypothetical protein